MDYIKNAMRTNPSAEDYDKIITRFNNRNIVQLMHAAMGIMTESGELMDQLKRHTMYGKDLDIVNLKEELGDLFWYIALMAKTLDVSFDELQEKNIAKLKARFGEKFTEDEALNRDLGSERKTLEGGEK